MSSDTSSIASSTAFSRSASPELEYPYTHVEFDALSLSQLSDITDDGYDFGCDYSDIDRRLNLPSPTWEHEMARSPSPFLFPLDLAVDYAPEKVFLSPLMEPLPIPIPSEPPVCGMCSTPPSICLSCVSIPQIAHQSPPIQKSPECAEKLWARAAAIQACMVGATHTSLYIPIRDCLARVADFIYHQNIEVSEESDPGNPINSWGSQVSDETWDTTPPSSKPSKPSDHHLFSQFTHMSVTPDAPVIPLTPPPSPANDWSSTTRSEERRVGKECLE